MEQANKFELHYFLEDNTHLIDAFIRHKCESEVLAITRDLALALGFEIEIFSEPFAEGGFKEYWKLAGKNSNQLMLVASIVALILSRIPVSNTELEKLQKENLLLDNEVKRLTIEKLKDELDKNSDISSVVSNTVSFFDSDYKIIKHKSNFYNALQGYPKVTQIATSLYANDKKVSEDNYVERENFHKFILSTDDLPSLTIEDASIEIIAPVLKGKYKWKGLYEGNPIDFFMNDTTYKKSVTLGQASFKSGCSIKCVLQVSRKIDDLGNIIITSYSVKTVLETIEDSIVIETEQGKKYKKTKDDLSNQARLF